jgi:hypothetical protein
VNNTPRKTNTLVLNKTTLKTKSTFVKQGIRQRQRSWCETRWFLKTRQGP